MSKKPMKYVRKNEVVEAFCWGDQPLPDWLIAPDFIYTRPDANYMYICDSRGNLRVNVGDFLVKDVDGKVYVYTKESFAAIFDSEPLPETIDTTCIKRDVNSYYPRPSTHLLRQYIGELESEEV